MADFIIDPDLWEDTAYPFYRARQWFVDKLTAYVPEAEMAAKLTLAKTTVRPYLAADHPLFKQESDMERGALQKDWSDAMEQQLRAEILYGLLGVYREFFDPVYEAYLRFTARRRYRIVVRMTRFVDPNFAEDEEGPVFVYPRVSSALNYQLNEASQPYWQQKAGKYPFVLKPAGRADPVSAVAKLFQTYRGPGEIDTESEGYDPAADRRNKLGCEAVVAIVHLDSLLVAKNPKTVLDKAIAEGSDYYIRIDHPIGSTVYLPTTGTPWVDGYVTIAEDAPLGATRLRLELSHFPVGSLSSIVQSFAGEHIVKTLTTRPFHIVDGTPPVMVAGQPDDFVGVTGFVIDRSSVTDDTTYTGWLEVQPLRRAAKRGARLVSEGNPEPHFANDLRPSKALFEHRFVAQEDLLVGDHVILENHPLYVNILIGEWQAEHSFVTGIFRNQKIETAGHGLSEPLEDIAKRMIGALNRHLGLLQEVARMHVLIRNEDPGFHQPRCFDGAGNQIDCASSRVSLRINVTSYFPFEYRDADHDPYMVREIHPETGELKEYTLVPEPTSPIGPEGIVPAQRAAFVAERGTKRSLLVLQNDDELRQFWFHYQGANPQFVSPVPGDPLRLESWGIPYRDGRHVKPRVHFLFLEGGPSARPEVGSWLTYQDLRGQFPIYGDASLGKISVVRPRVDFSLDYQNYLRRIEAI